MVREWFKEWFDSPYYRVLYTHRDDIEAKNFLENIEVELGIEANSKVLDIACGEGRFSKLLAEKGHSVLGLDLSEENIERATKQKSDRASFIQHDMRAPFHFVDEKFDFAFNFFTSFGYFETVEEHEKTLINIADVLKSGGEFILDFLNVEKLKGTIRPNEKKVINGIRFDLNRTLDGDTVRKKIFVHPPDSNVLYFEERVKAFGLRDFEMMFKEVPLEIQRVYGDYQLNSFKPETSDRLILRAKKLNL
ncbi:MAG: methyltransferase domain-containing protein [Bacteroidetes bacterium]|jgi:SAM-dependent methyltransferase|nr:methyltransferase domain-containing protein [Bacteroidota bacterium]